MSEPWLARRKVVTFPGQKSCNPVNVLARTLDKARAGEIKSVSVVIEWNDGTVQCDWSLTQVSILLMMAKMLEVSATRMLLSADDDEPFQGPTG